MGSVQYDQCTYKKKRLEQACRKKRPHKEVEKRQRALQAKKGDPKKPKLPTH